VHVRVNSCSIVFYKNYADEVDDKWKERGNSSVRRPERNHKVIRGTIHAHRDELLETAEPVRTEADQQRLQPVDVHLSADRLHVDELAEDGVGQLDVEGGRDETAVCQNHLEVVAGLGEDRSSVERVDWQLKARRKSIGADGERLARLAAGHVTEHKLHANVNRKSLN